MRRALCGGAGLDGDGRGGNDGGGGAWTRINATEIGTRAKGGRGGASRKFGTYLLCICQRRHTDVVDLVVARGGDEEERVVRGEGSGQGSSNNRVSGQRDRTHRTGGAARNGLIVWQRNARSGVGCGRGIGDEGQVGRRRGHHLVDGGGGGGDGRRLGQCGLKHQRRDCIAKQERIIGIRYRRQAI